MPVTLVRIVWNGPRYSAERVGLGIVGLELRGAAVEPEQDHRGVRGCRLPLELAARKRRRSGSVKLPNPRAPIFNSERREMPRNRFNMAISSTSRRSGFPA